MSRLRACAECQARSWLLARLAGHLDRARDRIDELLELGDEQLIDALAGRRADELRRRHAAFDAAEQHARVAAAGLEVICRCDSRYPRPLHELAAPPATLHVGGGLERALALVQDRPVAIVGARHPSAYGRTVARSLAAGLGAAGLTVVSGMALGIDSAAHEGALDARAATVAVLPSGADRAYPTVHRRLHGRIQEDGAVISELAPGAAVHRWMFPARNRVIAALSAMTIVVQAGSRSGALLTAGWAQRLGRRIGAVPGQVTSSLSTGPHGLLRDGADLVDGAQDVLDRLYGIGARPPPKARRARLEPDPAALLDAIAEGHAGAAAFTRAGLDTDRGLAALASLELAGVVRRGAGGRFEIVAFTGR